ncbi:MAG: hypothetical protein J7M03_05985 [Candidatus Desulfofervidaceae bacterium]|nr:hypothetical protein [Candidatus Desulfofervidaceae bacterium]MDL1969976.1 hypothetical protein [Candidatus Desulfofervidaceae bacterium]
MRQLLFDEIGQTDIKKIKHYLNKHAELSPLGGIYWVNLPEGLWDETQKAHTTCQPFYFAIEVGGNYVRIELLIRSRQKLHCECIKYANSDQRNFILEFADNLLSTLKIRT